ncbi:MAG: mevalonate kinase [Sporolactobacillus sp.]
MSEQHMGIGISSGKVILIGEHSVVYGKPAIAMPVPAARAITETMFRPGPLRLQCAFYKGELSQGSSKVEGLKKVIPAVLERLGRPEADLMLKISSDIPAERGMGSSAAVSISVVRSLYHYFESPLDRKTLLTFVGLSETYYHDAPSGLDAATASSSYPIYFVKNRKMETLRQAIDAWLVIADTGIKGQTKQAVTVLRKQAEQDPDIQCRINRLGDLAAAIRNALQEGKAIELGREMLEAHRILQKIGVSHSSLDHLVYTAMIGDTLGAKMTGGGRGGCMIALVRDEERARQLAKRLANAGAVGTWIQPLDGPHSTHQ